MPDTKAVTCIPTAAAPQQVPDLAAGLDVGVAAAQTCRDPQTAPVVLLTAKTQRWRPQEVLRTKVQSELAAPDATNIVNRLSAAAFPVAKTLESFDHATSGCSWTLRSTSVQPIPKLRRHSLFPHDPHGDMVLKKQPARTVCV